MDELELQTREVLEGKEVTKNIFPFQVRTKTLLRAYIHQLSDMPSGRCLTLLCRHLIRC